MTCEMEMCSHWTGDGCACSVLDLEPDTLEPDTLAEARVWK